MISILSIVTIVSIGLMIGVEFAVWVFINPLLRQLREPARTEAVRLFARKLGKAMPFWYSANMVLLLAAAIAFRRQSGSHLLDAAAAIWAIVIVLTISFLVPINNRLAQQESPLQPAAAHREHKRWDAMHRARVIALAAAFVLLLSGLNV